MSAMNENTPPNATPQRPSEIPLPDSATPDRRTTGNLGGRSGNQLLANTSTPTMGNTARKRSALSELPLQINDRSPTPESVTPKDKSNPAKGIHTGRTPPDSQKSKTDDLSPTLGSASRLGGGAGSYRSTVQMDEPDTPSKRGSSSADVNTLFGTTAELSDPTQQSPQMPQHIDVTRTRQSAAFKSPRDSPDPRRESSDEVRREALVDILSTTGVIDMPNAVHFYTMKIIDIETGKSSHSISKLIYNRFLHQFGNKLPDELRQVSVGTFMTLNNCLVPEKAPGYRSLSNSIFSVELYHSQTLAEDGYTKIHTEPVENGKAKRTYVKLGDLEMLPTSFSGAVGKITSRCEAEGLEEAAIDQVRAHGDLTDSEQDSSRIAVWFQHRKINTSDAKSAFATNGSASLTANDVIAIVNGFLNGKLCGAKEPVGEIVFNGTKAFTTEIEHHSGKSRIVPSGLEVRKGLQGKLMSSEDGNLQVAYEPCTGLFFKNATVSDLIVSFNGHIQAAKLTSNKVNELQKLLKGVKVAIPIQDGYGKQIRIIQGLAHTPGHKPKSFTGLKGNISIGDLRYPSMPCVDVGNCGRPFYFPAEVCLILPDQMFHGDIPAVDKSVTELLKLKQEKPLKALKSKDGNPFENASTDDFKLWFASVAMLLRTRSPKTLRSEAMKQFQHELGQRFDRKLELAVADAQSTKFDFQGIDKLKADVSRFTRGAGGPRHVLVLAVDDDVNSSNIDAIRTHCETVIGVQCCFVNVSELEKRYHPVENRKMVMYTGQIVRKIFARANIPADFETDHTTSDDKKGNGRLFGIHMTSMENFSQNSGPKTIPLDMGQYYLVTTVSVPSADATDLCTTSQVVKISDKRPSLSALQNHIETCFKGHLAKLSTQSFNESSIYLTGLPMGDESEHKSLRASFEEMLCLGDQDTMTSPFQDQKDGRRPFNLIIYSARHQVSMDEQSVRIHLKAPQDALVWGTDMATGMKHRDDKILSDILRDDFNLHHRALSPIYKASEKGTHIWHVVYQFSMPERRGQITHGYLPCIERRSIPDILHLTQAASKRCQSRVYFTQCCETGEMKVAISPVRPELAQSLYFI